MPDLSVYSFCHDDQLCVSDHHSSCHARPVQRRSSIRVVSRYLLCVLGTIACGVGSRLGARVWLS
eukprot:355181-Heterocapsa_arctica.AAC.1